MQEEHNLDKYNTLQQNRDVIINQIFEYPSLYLDVKIFEDLCNNLDLIDGDVDKLLIEHQNFENLNLETIYYLENKTEIYVEE